MMEITQADREAAWPTRPEAYHDEACKPAWFAGVYDKCQHIQSYAAHRIASEQAVLAKLRERFEDLCEKGDRSINYIGKYDVAALIDALEQKP